MREMVNLQKQFESQRTFYDDKDEDSDHQMNALTQSDTLPLTFKGKMKQISSNMSKLMNALESLIKDKNLQEAYSEVKLHSSEWIGQVDGYERNLLHLAVERDNKKMVEALLLAGAEVNVAEGCGITPLNDSYKF